MRTFDGDDEYRQYMIDYWFRGGTRSVYVWARSWDEAEEHAVALRHGKVIGKLDAVINAHNDTAPILAVLIDAWCRSRNWIRRKARSLATP